ncbi:proline racemase family protein [Marinomonas lutimaris]|uniref:proline racemase family protein n=1 Tax=Marinomonas lutimaris TaxID=2846746 RepID=UPI001CA5BABE|nr:proline racemase family protein [Marinomonas lutimaris]
MSELGVHAEGEIGRVIIDGALDILGKTMMEKMVQAQADLELKVSINLLQQRAWR